MRCPVDREAMIVVEHNKVELDYCVHCAGVWFDSGELELLLETMDVKNPHSMLGDLAHAPAALSAERKKKCPICGRRMRKAHLGTKPKVLIDVCPRGDGLWFDRGEVDGLIAQLKGETAVQGDSGAHGHVISFLGRVFRAKKDKDSITAE